MDLTLPHPRTGGELRLHAPPAADFDPRRFRPNVLIDSAETGLAEVAWCDRADLAERVPYPLFRPVQVYHHAALVQKMRSPVSLKIVSRLATVPPPEAPACGRFLGLLK